MDRRDENHHEFILTLGQIQADMRDVAFYFKKKSGFPKLSDSGLADVLLGGEGLTVTAHVVSADKDRSSVFKVKNVHVKVGTLKFSIRDSKHDMLYKTLRPLATGLVKKQLQKAIADAVTTGLEYVDGQLVGVRDRMADAKASEDKSRTQVLQEVSLVSKVKAAVVHTDNFTCHSCSSATRKRLPLPSQSLMRRVRTSKLSLAATRLCSLSRDTPPAGSTAPRSGKMPLSAARTGAAMRRSFLLLHCNVVLTSFM